MLLFFSPVLTQRHGARSCQHISYTPLTPNYAHYNMYDVYRVNNSNVMTNPHSPLYYIRPLQTWKNIASPHYRLLSVVRFEIHVDKMSKKNWIVDIKPRNDGIWHTMVPFKWYVSDIKFFASTPWTLSRLFFHLREHNAIAQLPFRRHSSWTIRLQRRSKYDKEHTYGVYNCEQYKWYNNRIRTWYWIQWHRKLEISLSPGSTLDIPFEPSVQEIQKIDSNSRRWVATLEHRLISNHRYTLLTTMSRSRVDREQQRKGLKRYQPP